MAGSVFNLRARTGDPAVEEDIINDRVGFIFAVRRKASLKHRVLFV